VLAQHNITNALAAAALARGFGVPPAAVRDGLRAYLPLPHRLNPVARSGEITWVDDSAATDPVAAAAGLAAFERVVWVAGGGGGEPVEDPASVREHLAELVAGHASRLRAAVLLGPDRNLLREALQRHAPDVPVVDVDVAETGTVPVMEVVVARAGQFAQPGDTVLLSPAFGAEPFTSLDQRGAAFAAAARDRAQS
jgi:UDP-N-acetylmuramoylalanine--D-glutamate ligase